MPRANKLVKWLEHASTLKEGGKVDWKRQYKVRSNWHLGAAKFHEVEVATPPAPPVLAKVHKGLVFTVDARAGLRVWSQNLPSKDLQAQIDLQNLMEPTSLAVDGRAGVVDIIVGFQNGYFRLYRLSSDKSLTLQLEHQGDADTPITSTALSMPYAVTMSSDRHIHLYHLIDEQSGQRQEWSIFVLTSLHADSPLHPASLALRCVSNTVIATISYAFNRLAAGWCLGLQEIRVGAANGEIQSRTTSNIETPIDARYRGTSKWEISSRSAFSTPLSSPFALQPHLKSAPSCLSYSHPFLLASLSDNTIMSYIVTSDDTRLEISSGKRLWGHTSAVSGAEVSSRGKAVSVSAKGEEIRVWELEDALTTVGRGKSSTQVRPTHPVLDVMAAVAKRGNGLGLALQEMERELAFTRRWVGFDDEQVVIMGERDDRQIMGCYDFS